MKKKHSNELSGQFFAFIEAHPPRKFSNSLRRMLLDYLAHEVNVGLHTHFDMFLYDLYDLFELMDKAEGYQRKKEGKKVKPSSK